MEAALIALLLSLLAPLAIGALVVSWMGVGAGRDAGSRALRGGLTVGLGLGLCSSWCFLWAMLFGIGPVAVWTADAVLIAILALLRGFAPPAGDPGPATVPAQHNESRGPLLVLGVFVALAAASCLLISWSHPHGDGDAMAIWNMRARYLYGAWGEWSTVFFPQGLVHVDYPLLVPMLVVRGWVYAGTATALVPIAIGMLFTFATVAVLFGALAVTRGRIAGALGAVALLGTPLFVRHGVEQTADVPLAFFVLVAVVLAVLRRADQKPASPGLFVGIGWAAGCAAWSKNEGLVFAGLLLVALAAAEARRGRGRAVLALAAGVLLPALALAYFKIVLAPANDLVAEQSFADVAARASDPARWAKVGVAFLERMVWLTDEPLVQSGFAVLAICALCVGRDRRVPFAVIPALVLAGMAAIYFAIFVAVTPYDLDWHLPTSVNRLLLQLWPGTVFVVFAALRFPTARRGDVV